MSENESSTANQPMTPGDVRVVDLTSSTPRKDLKFYKAFSLAFKAEDGTVYEGTFVVKRLSIGDLSKVGVVTAQLDGGLENVPPHIHNMNAMLAHLQVALVEKPTWFKPEELYDQGLVLAVYTEVGRFESTFRAAVG